MCGVIFYHGGVYVLALCVITSTAITNIKDKDRVNTNALGDEASRKGNLSRHKDGISRETIEKRTFAKPDFDRRGSFYPSGHGFHVGTSIDVGEPGPGFMDDRNFHTSGNGYSYGTPNAHYPPVWYSPSYPSAGPGHGSYRPPAAPGHGGYGPPGFGVPSFDGPGIGGFGGGHDGGGYGGHGGPSVGGIHPHAVPLKGLLIPIAGVALLGAAAALAKTHPVLLQLGVISGKRKRSLDYTTHYPSNPYARPNFNSIS